MWTWHDTCFKSDMSHTHRSERLHGFQEYKSQHFIPPTGLRMYGDWKHLVLSERMVNRCSVSEESTAWPVCVGWLVGLRAEESPDSWHQTGAALIRLHCLDSLLWADISFLPHVLPSLGLIMMTCVLLRVSSVWLHCALWQLQSEGKERWACIIFFFSGL